VQACPRCDALPHSPGTDVQAFGTVVPSRQVVNQANVRGWRHSRLHQGALRPALYSGGVQAGRGKPLFHARGTPAALVQNLCSMTERSTQSGKLFLDFLQALMPSFV
jgi:hypothetical protein